MESLTKSTEWALAQGVRLNGIAVHRIPGRGVGIIGKRTINIGEILLTIPVSALRTFETVSESILKSIGSISVHGLLAAELALEASNTNSPWSPVLSTEEEFKERMPLMWPSELQMLLPATSLVLLSKQKSKLALDWSAVSVAFPHLSYDDYVHHWFLVNTRTFYYTSSNPKTKNPLDSNDCLALVPFADYFNHAGVGCKVTFSPSEYVFRADRQYEKGEEIFMSYGQHNSDLLLVEYGFTPDENRWDEVSLDESILPLFSEEQEKILDDAGFLGCYVLDKETICYRTRVAVSLLCMPLNKWRRFLTEDFDGDDQYETEVARITLKALHALLEVVDEKLRRVSSLEGYLLGQVDMLRKRWEQILLLLRTAAAKLEV